MHICFIDESTTPPKPTRREPKPYFAIAGVVIPITQWHAMARELQQLKDRPEYRIRGEIKWRYFGAGNNDPKNTVRHLSQEARVAFRRDFFAILTRRNSVKVIACVTKVERAYELSYINDEHDLYGYTYKPVSERFQYFLQDLGRNAGVEQYGIIVADHRGRDEDARLRKEHQRLIHSTSPYVSNYSQLAESLFLTPSHQSLGIQFADMAAGAVSRRFNSDDAYWFDVIRPAFRSRSDGVIDGFGLVKFPSLW